MTDRNANIFVRHWLHTCFYRLIPPLNAEPNDQLLQEEPEALWELYDFEISPESWEREHWFPDPRMGGRDDDMLCEGPEVTPESVGLAYRYGIFPWYAYKDGDVPQWYAPLDRFVLFPEKVHISHSLRTLLNKGRYRVTFNRAFPQVIMRCARVDGRDSQDGAWLGDDMIRAYTRLWQEGMAKSVEIWEDGNDECPVGGLYGIYVNDCFMGESMFSDVPSGSKIALVGLCEWMREHGGKMIDLQFETPYLESMGGEHLPYYDYLSILNPEAADEIELDFHNPYDDIESIIGGKPDILEGYEFPPLLDIRCNRD